MNQLRTYISLLLVMGIFVGTLWQTLTVVHFYFYQDSITAEHCINKDKPALNCKGKCHLKEQLTKTNPDQNKNLVNSKIVKSGLILFAFFNSTSDKIFTKVNFKTDFSSNTTQLLTGYLSTVYSPPDFK